MSLSRLVLAFILALLLAPFALGQTTGGSISGTVADPNGAVIPNAAVTVTQAQRDVTQTAVSGSQGGFRFLQLPAGTYSLSIKVPGFKVYEQSGIVLEGNANLDLRTLALAVGSTNEIVEVRAEGVQLETENAERSETLTNGQMENTAVNGRTYLGLVGLIPGVATVPNVQTASHSGLGSISVNGQRGSTNNLTIDGIGNVDTGNNGDQLVTISLDNVQEFRVITNNFQPQYGRSSGSQIIVVTRSGTERYHGEGYIFHRNDSLNANNWINNRQQRPRNKQRYNDVGFNIGGPIQIPHLFTALHNKAFFFVGQEYQKQLNPQGLKNVRVPTTLERTGDFSQSTDNSGNLYPYIRDYTLGKPCNAQNTTGCFQDGGVIGKIPTSRLYALGLPILNAYPLPNINGGNYNFTSGISDSYPRREDVVRIDVNPNDKTRLFYRWLNNQDSVSSNYGSFVLGTNVPTTPIKDSRPGSGMALGITNTINPTMVNEILLGYGKNHISINPTTNKLSRATLGLSGLPVLYPGTVQQDLIPNFGFGGRLANTSSLTGGNPPFSNGNTTIEAIDNLSKSLGQHSVRVGFYFQRSRKDQTNFGPVDGSYNFGDDASNPYDSQQGFANAALGIYNSFSQASKYINGQFRYTNVEWYGQDSWMATKRLTLSYGLRFYYVQPQYDKNNLESGFDASAYNPAKATRLYQRGQDASGKQIAVDPVSGQTLPAYAIGAIVPNSGDSTNGIVLAGKTINRYLQKNPGITYGPRAGFTYALTPTSVIRGGAGIFYDRTQGNNVFGFVTNPPTIYTPTLRYGLVSQLDPATALLGPSNVSSRQYAAKLPTTYDYDLEIQQQLPAHILSDIAYVATTSSHLLQLVNLNAIPYGATFLPQNQDPVKVKQNPSAPLGANAKDQNFLRPYPGYGDIAQIQNGGSSNYHSLQVALNRRYASGLFFSVAYTWSKALGVSSTDGTYTRIDGRTRDLNYGPLAFDRRHTFATNIIYPFPSIFHHNSLLHTVVDGWQVSSIIRFQSGSPYMVTANVNGYNNQQLTGSYTEGSRVRIIGNPYSGISKDPYHRLNPAAFAAPVVGDPGVGQEGQNPFTGPGINNTDLTLEKQFKIKERYNFQMRADAFNVFNHTQFRGINSGINFAGPGNANFTNPASNTPSQYNGFGSVSGARDPRIVQLIGRITF
ncbi:MAG: carboxypeptidase regulatory-like domain-containing protein [Acidobacteriaceae bacterium]